LASGQRADRELSNADYVFGVYNADFVLTFIFEGPGRGGGVIFQGQKKPKENLDCFAYFARLLGRQAEDLELINCHIIFPVFSVMLFLVSLLLLVADLHLLWQTHRDTFAGAQKRQDNIYCGCAAAG